LFFVKSRKLGINPFLLSYKLGSDLNYLISHINFQLTATIEKKLSIFLDERDSSIPLPMLVLSISNLYRGLIISWFTEFKYSNVRQCATNIQLMIWALIIEAISKNATCRDRDAQR
jgi:hypothetical protein